MLYKVFMVVSIPAIIIGWVVYWLWNKKIEEEEKNRPKPVSKRLTQTRNEISDWAKKMANSDSPAEQARKRKLAMEKEWEEKEKQRERENQKEQ
jgi:hypothetical protein